jgi:hypothetical protein
MPNIKLLKIVNSSFLILIGLCVASILQAQANNQPNKSEQLKILSTAKEDTSKVEALRELAEYYIGPDTDSSLLLAKMALALSEKINYDRGKIKSLFTMGKVFAFIGNYSRGLNCICSHSK